MGCLSFMFAFNYTAGVLWISATLKTQHQTYLGTSEIMEWKENTASGVFSITLSGRHDWDVRNCSMTQKNLHVTGSEKVWLFVIHNDIVLYLCEQTILLFVKVGGRLLLLRGHLMWFHSLGVLSLEVLQSIDQNESWKQNCQCKSPSLQAYYYYNRIASK